MGVIFIGLGGTGLEILSKTKSKLSHILTATTPDVAFIPIDVGCHDCPPNLSTDFVSLDGGNVENTIQGANFPYVEPWWFSKEYAPPFVYSKGAWQLRVLGRLALYLHGDRVLTAIRSAVKQIGNNNIDFIVISSTAGGTGSGLFRDFPGIISHIMGNQNYNVYGLLISHDIVNRYYGLTSQGKELSASNALCLLQEIDAAVAKKGSDETLILNDVTPVRINMMKPYQIVYLIFYNNEKGKFMDMRDDYSELAACALENLYYMSVGIRGPSFSGLENSQGAILAVPTLNISLPLEGAATWDSPFEVGRIYSSFSNVIIEFAEDEAKKYIENLFLKEMIENSLTITKTPKEIDAKVTSFVTSFAEAQNQDRLVTKAYELFRLNAQRQDDNILKDSPANKIDRIKKMLWEKVKEENDPGPVIKAIQSRISLIAAGNMKDEFDEFLRKEKETFGKKVNEAYEETSFSFADRRYLIRNLRERVEFEKTEFNREEIAWLNINTENKINSDIQIQIGEISNLINSSLLKRWFKGESIQNGKLSCCENISKTLINYYEKQYVYNAISIKIINFFDEIIYEIKEKGKELESLIERLEDEKNSIKLSYPDKIEPVGVGRGKVDFRIIIAHSRDILNDKLVNPNVEKCRRNFPAKIANCIEDFRKRAYDLASQIVNDITLDNALEWESEYFWEKMAIQSEINGRVSIFGGFSEAIKKSTDSEWNHLINKYGEFFDLQSIQFLRNNKVSDKKVAIDKLIDGRIKLSLDTWKYAFCAYADPPDPPLKKGMPAKYVTYGISIGDDAVRINTESEKLIARYARDNWGTQVSRVGNVTSRTKAFFINFCLGSILMAVNSFIIPSITYESERKSRVKKLLSGAPFKGPESSGLHYSDKRFIENVELLSHTPIINVNLEPEEYLLPFKAILLLLSLGKLELSGSKFILRGDFKTEKEILIPSGASLGNLAEMYRILFSYYLDELAGIIKLCEAEMQTLSEKERSTKLLSGYDKLKMSPDFRKVVGAAIPIMLENYMKELNK